MSTPKRSPGPWHVIRYQGVTKVVDANGDTICDDEDYYPQSLDPNNAHIIAASPDLLDVAKLFYECFTDHDIRWKDIPVLRVIYYSAKAAINKAEGRTV